MIAREFEGAQRRIVTWTALSARGYGDFSMPPRVDPAVRRRDAAQHRQKPDIFGP